MATGGKGPQGDINITPLVDIVLVLLIIFMVITPMLSKHIEIEVPQKAETEEPEDTKVDKQMVLALFADGHVELNTNAIASDEALKAQLMESFANRKREDSVLFFEAEDDAPYGKALHLMDLAKGAGVVTIGVMTPKDDEEEGLPSEGGEGGAPTDGDPAEAPLPG